jgi:hypothetical protein
MMKNLAEEDITITHKVLGELSVIKRKRPAYLAMGTHSWS